jgi:nucleoside-diphosphate-sugar epimerase
MSVASHGVERRPESIRDVEHLEDLLSAPTPEVVEALARVEGDLIVLGVAGKMGPSLARMARRAFNAAGKRGRVIGVARFSDPNEAAQLERHGVEAIRCDLLDRSQLGRLPDAPNVVYMAGRKFGSTGAESMTWAVNAFLPGLVCEKYARSRIVAFSTGNIYGLTRLSGGGSREGDVLAPAGEYAMSCMARERIFEHFSRTGRTPVALVRLNYATEMRYGVLVDLAQRVLAEQPVDLTMGAFNTIWQADANAMALRCLDHCATPPFVINITGDKRLHVSDVAARFGELLDRPISLQGTCSDSALLSDNSLSRALFGSPRVGAEQLIEWTADWIRRGGLTHGKPTHFEVRDGRF